MIFEEIEGVPRFECVEFENKKKDYCLCIPVINEGERILSELKKAKELNVSQYVDIIICDGNSTDGSINYEKLKSFNVNTLLIKKDIGKQGAQLRMGFFWCLKRGYKGIVTIDGNNKDSIENVQNFVEKLKEGYDFIQGSRFINGGHGINTPFERLVAIRLIHAPIISITARHIFTDTTNGFRGYSANYLLHPRVQPFRDIFMSYELLAYLSVKASQLNLKVCEVPVTRMYPINEKTPTKISGFSGQLELFTILMKNLLGYYNVKKGEKNGV